MAAEDGSPPPTLVISLDDDDDGYPTTPPVLERQDYIDETCDVQEVVVHEEVDEGEIKDYDSPFPMPEKMRSFNAREYFVHSKYFLLDVLCILCQRVCNETYVMKCCSYHRFCKECIMPRWEAGNERCPRCNVKCTEAPEPDPVYDEIITDLRYDKNLVNFIDCDESETEDSDSEYASCSGESEIDEEDGSIVEVDTDDEMSPDEDQKGGDEEYSEEEEGDYDPEERLLGLPSTDRNYLVRRYKRRNGLPVEGKSPSPSSDNNIYIEIPPQFSKENRRKPLENMVYKDFECNANHEWPTPNPPTPSLDVPREILRQIPKINKMKRYYFNNKYLTKREKKICIHYHLTNICDPPIDQEQYASSSDDDDPPEKFTKTRFDYPDGYRKPRKDWRVNFTEDGKPKQIHKKKGVKSGPFDAKAALKELSKYRWRPQWGNPLLLIRESSTKSSFDKELFQRVYMGAPDNTTIAHLKIFVYNKIRYELDCSLEEVKKLYIVNFHVVVREFPGTKLRIIKCDDNVAKLFAATLTWPKRAPPPRPRPMALQRPHILPRHMLPSPIPVCRPSTSGINLNRMPTLTGMTYQTIQVGEKRVSFPVGRKEPTLREFALKTMCLRDDKKMANSRRQMSAAFPDSTIHIETVPIRLTTGAAPAQPIKPANQPLPIRPSPYGRQPSRPQFMGPSARFGPLSPPPMQGRPIFPAPPMAGRAIPPLYPVSTRQVTFSRQPAYVVQGFPPGINPMPSHSIAVSAANTATMASEIMQIVPIINSQTQEVTYNTMTPDGKLIPLALPKGSNFISMPQNKPVFLNSMIQQQLAQQAVQQQQPAAQQQQLLQLQQQPQTSQQPDPAPAPAPATAPEQKRKRKQKNQQGEASAEQQPGPSHQQSGPSHQQPQEQTPPQPKQKRQQKQQQLQEPQQKQQPQPQPQPEQKKEEPPPNQASAKTLHLKDTCTVYSTRRPLRAIPDAATCGHMRMMKNLYRGDKLVIFFSIRDRMSRKNVVPRN